MARARSTKRRRRTPTRARGVARMERSSAPSRAVASRRARARASRAPRVVAAARAVSNALARLKTLATTTTARESRARGADVARAIVDAFEALARAEARGGRRAEGDAVEAARRAALGRAADDDEGRESDGESERDARAVDALYGLRRAVHAEGCSGDVRVNCARVVEAFAREPASTTTEARWRALVDCVPNTPRSGREIVAMASPNARVGVGSRDWALSVGAALATAARWNDVAATELFELIDDKIQGGAGERVVGLTLLHAALAVDGLVASDDLVVAVHKALTAVSGAPVENGFACASVGMRCVCAAARNLSMGDVRTLRSAWLEPRLRAQGFTWHSAQSDESRATLSLIEYLKIPRDERLGATAMSAFLIADLDLVGYVDAEEFKRKVVHGSVDLDSPAFRALAASERAVGRTVAAAIIATQMNLIHTLYVAPGQEDDADELRMKVATEGGRILCGKALDLLRLERANTASLTENAQMKVEELTTDAQPSTFFGVLSYALTTNVIDIDENERAKLVSWCCDKLSEKFVTATDASMRAMITSGCLSALLRLAETSENAAMADACMQCVSVLIDLILVPSTLYDFVEIIAFKTPSLDLLGVESKSEDDKRATYVVAALNWSVSRIRASSTVAQADKSLNLFRRLFVLLPETEHTTWLEYFTDAYASAALWAGCVEKEVAVDTDRVLADDAARKCVESFEADISRETSKKTPEWLGNLQTRARWLNEAFAALGEDAYLRAHFTADLAAIMSKSVDVGLQGSTDPKVNASYWPYESKRPLIVPRAPLGPGGILATSAATFDLIAKQLESQFLAIETSLQKSLMEHTGLIHMMTTVTSAVAAAGVAIKTPGGASAGRVAAAAARALVLVAQSITHLHVTVNCSEMQLRTEERELLLLTKQLLEASNVMEQRKTLEAAPGVHRRRYAAARAALARALSLTDASAEDIKFELNKIRKRRHSKRWTEKHQRPPTAPRPASAVNFTAREAEPDDFVDEDGVSILEAFEPSTDEESDSGDNDDDAFVVRGMQDFDEP